MTIHHTDVGAALTPGVSPRVQALVAEMTLDEKLAQLVGYWVDQGDEVVAPLSGEKVTSTAYADATVHGLGHLTRVYGTRPVDPIERAQWLWGEQRRLKTETRLGIPAIVHEECLTGFAAWKAATFPTPLAWGASFDPETIELMASAIGRSMRDLGVHQGLSPVLDVVRDPRWGRVDECIAEDPYVVGTIGTAYVRGLQSAGVHATLKHFVGYSGSRAGRNHAPVSAGPRELQDVFLPPFEMAVRDGGVRSVMNSYTEIDGVPVASSPELLTDLLRRRWGFDGTVVSDYFAVEFLRSMHGIAGSLGEAAQLALEAGIDVELPGPDAYPHLAERVASGALPEAVVDRAVARVLAEKEDLGLLDADFADVPTEIDLDDAEHRALAYRLALESAVLLRNDGVLPLAAPGRIAVIGPNADSAEALMGCYSFANHVLAHHPGTPMGFDIPTVREALESRFAAVSYAVGCAVEGSDTDGFAEAVAVARDAEVAIVVVGDRAGLFGRGTVGEGNDAESLELPGRQRQLVEAIVATGTPVVLLLLTGRPYALSWALDGDSGPAAVLQAFFPGEEGGPALAALLAGDATPSGRLPVSLPRSAGAQPYSYLHPLLGGPSGVTSTDPTPVRPFGFGLSYTTFERGELRVDGGGRGAGEAGGERGGAASAGLRAGDASRSVGISASGASPEVRAGDAFTVSARVTNTGTVRGADVVQVYTHRTGASVTRPLAALVAYARVELDPGESAEIRFTVPSSRLAYSDRAMRRVVEPGEIELRLGPSCAEVDEAVRLRVTGPTYELGPDDARVVEVEVRRG
ncbi:glycoside hydrolase family 3 N-terminal domain-containing protein [Microbacterium sp. Kw_RZR3]|uniref:beta-xylosidase/alpha-l-arabinosidase n=1 Tax=Microbacterium sp. Kw_RZR3 TaxID=3032903 RepID=UPI0023D98A37|nr:glycoside hydrolase family 3 N-terminal domain-containing protein [Microbacterium sp. Kw_RZR3]MDF2046722.1 glycoside hydrolase family 3 N-terminal domain-containing protein [Microbacterium sp. Kw_RZR3]